MLEDKNRVVIVRQGDVARPGIEGDMVPESIFIRDNYRASAKLRDKVAERLPHPDHPFGYGPERYFWAFLVASSLYPSVPSTPHEHNNQQELFPRSLCQTPEVTTVTYYN